jgi:hypothetical protein
MTAMGRGASLGLVLAALTACATMPDGSQLRGTSGPVAWEVVDMVKTRPSPETIRWDYVLILKERAGTGIQFDTGDAGLSGARVSPIPRQFEFRRRLEPNSELRVPRSATCSQCREYSAGTVFVRYFGKDDFGKRVTIRIRVPLN